jgi:hypothetical protein
MTEGIIFRVIIVFCANALIRSTEHLLPGTGEGFLKINTIFTKTLARVNVNVREWERVARIARVRA